MENMPNDEVSINLGWAILACGILGVGGQWLSSKLDHPALGIFSRWARWFLFTFGFSFTAVEFGWTMATGPLWNLLAISFLLWFLLESIYMWLAIRKFSMDDLPVFPKHVSLGGTREWPAQPYFIRVREWLRETGYEQIEATRAFLGEEDYLHTFHFENSEKTIRTQITFTQNGFNPPRAIFTFSSVTNSGKRQVTDNAFLPRAGVLPIHWRLKRMPLVRSLARLEEIHRSTMRDSGETFVAWEESPLEDANEQQRILEKTNVEKGILFAKNIRDKKGMFTQEGCYRMWLELWCLKYFGTTKN